MKTLFSVLCLAAVTAGAAPTVSSVAVAQNATTHDVTVTYSLNERAIVTFGISTNGVAVASEALSCAYGDVCRLVDAGSRSFVWRPDAGFPNQNLAAAALKVTVKAWAPNDPPAYFTVDLRRPQDKRFYADAESIPLGVTNDLYKTHVLAMRRIPAKDVVWRMGGANDSYHNVKLTQDYYIGVYEMTQQQYVDFYGSNPSQDQTNVNWRTRPVEYFAQYNAIAFVRGDNCGTDCAANTTNTFNSARTGYLTNLRTSTGVAFDLPTEAQWEFAARAGSGAAWVCGESSADLKDYGWFKDNSTNELGILGTHPVGLKKPNRWGLYDMAGNVLEACIDWNTSGYGLSSTTLADASAVQVDPNGGAKLSIGREKRGGAYSSSANDCRHFARGSSNDGDALTGLRLVCPIDMTGK